MHLPTESNQKGRGLAGMAWLSLKYFLPSFGERTETTAWQQSGTSKELLCGGEAALGQSGGDWGDGTQSCVPAAAGRLRLPSGIWHR